MNRFIHRATRVADRITAKAGSELVTYSRDGASIEVAALAAGKENNRDWLIDACELGDFGRPRMGDLITGLGATWLVFDEDLDRPPWTWHDRSRTRLRVDVVSADEGLGYRTITVTAPTDGSASSGQVLKTFADYGTFPAVIKTVDGSTAWNRDVQNRATVDWKLILPSTDISRGITPLMRVQIDGKTFHLGAAYRHNLQNHYVVLEAREIVE